MTQPRTIGYWDPPDPLDAAIIAAFLAAGTAAGMTLRTDAATTGTWKTITLMKPPTQMNPLGPSESGIDFSHHNNGGKVIDFAKVRAAGHRFGWGKRSQGVNFTDPLGKQNFAAAVGQLDWIGNYHFFEWRQNGKDQADFFSLTCGEALGNLPELIDVELEPWDRPENVVKATAEANLRACLAQSEARFGRKPFIYTSRHYWTTMFDTARVADIARGYKFLVADWSAPLDLPIGLAWALFHQKSSTHQIPGLVGNWDLDEYRGDPPPFPSTPLYRARARVALNLRDRDGNVIPNAAVPAGAEIGVWQELALIGPNALGQVYEDRAVLAVDGRNVWAAQLDRL